MIILNNVYFDTIASSEKPALGQFASSKRSTTGKLIVTQTQVVSNERTFTLNVDRRQRLRLENLLTVLGPMDFIDPDGFAWMAGPGVDDERHAYNTGAYFKPPTILNFTPQNANGSQACDQHWNVEVTLLVNARGVRNGSASPMSNTILQKEVPAGTINGVNATFTLSAIPTSLILIVNGLVLTEGVDYTLSGSTITFLAGAIPQVGDSLLAYYTT